MTAPDPRSRPAKASETPPDGTATTGTDAAVRPHDADASDALDAWLESITASGARSTGHVDGSSPHRAGVNGSGPGESDTSLVATARQFHARIADAEASHATNIPETTLEAIIWERIMSSQFSQSSRITTAQPAAMQERIAPTGTPRPGQQDGDAGHPAPIIDRFTGGHPAFSAVLAAAVLLAIVAIFRMIGAPPSGPTDDLSSTIGPNSSANPALAAGSPLASPLAFDCAGPVSASSGSTSRISDYVPLNPVTDPALIDEANATLTIALECFDPDLPNQPNSIPSLTMTDATRDRIEAVRSMWPVDPWGYGASFDPESTALIDIDHRAKSTTIEPSELFEMPNGRFGAIAYQVSELPELQSNGEPFLGFIAFFLSFRPGEGPSETPLVLTEYFPLCADEDDGTTICDSATIPNPGHDNGSTPAATPAASPTLFPDASPAASDIERWVADPDTAACAVDAANPPGAVDDEWNGMAPRAGLLPFSETSVENQKAAAEVYLQFRSCREDDSATDPLVSDAFAALLAAGSDDIPREQQTFAREISEAYADRDPMSFIIEGDPLSRESSSPGYGSASRRVLLPDDVVQLADGRIGGPAHVFFQTNDPGGAASYLGPQGFLETGFVIFTIEDDRWVIDDFVQICIGDCDAYWTSREAEGTPFTGGPETGELASLDASGSLIVSDDAETQAELVRVPLDGGPPQPLPLEGYVSALRTSQPNVVILDDAQGNQVAYNVTTGIASKAFPTGDMNRVWSVGPYRIIGYNDPADLLIVDLRTMRLSRLSDLVGGSVGISDPTFAVQGDDSGNLLVGITSADDPGTTSAAAAFIDRDVEHVRILEGWTASGQGGLPGAIAPDGASIAYPARKDGAVVVRTESITGEPIRDYAWSGTSRILRLAFIDPTDLIVFSADTTVASPLPDGTISLIHPDAGNTAVVELGTFPAREDLEGPFMSPSRSSLMYATDGEIDGQAAPLWYLLDIQTGDSRELGELRGAIATLGPGEPIVRELVPLARQGTVRPGAPVDDMSIFWATFDLTIGRTRTYTYVMTGDSQLVDTSDHLVVAGLDPQTVTQLEGTGDERRVLFQSNGAIVVTDGATGTTWSKPLPNIGADWIVLTTLVLSPDGRHLALSAHGSDESPASTRTWATSLEAGAPWIEVGPYALHEWTGTPNRARASAQTAVAPATPAATGAAAPVAAPAARAAIPVAADEGTLLIDTGSGIVSRPLDGSPGSTLETYGPLGPPTYIMTTVPDVVIGGDGKTAHNVRTGQLLGTSPYDGSMVSGPFWVQYTSQNPAAPVDARIVDLRTMEMVEFFDLTGAEPAGLGPEWLIEGTESGALGVGLVDRAYGTGPTLTPTMLLVDGDLDRTRVVPLWSPRGTDGDVLAFSPDSSLVAYLTGTEGNVVIRVETTAGEPIADVPWPAGTPVDQLVLTDARTMLIMAEGQALRADLATGTGPAPIAGYTGAVRDAVLSPDGSHLLFATLDPLSGQSGYGDMDWHWLDIGTGEVRPIPQATGANQVWPGSSTEADVVMLWAPVGGFETATYRVLFVDMMTGAVTVGPPAGVTSGLVSGQATSEDGAVFAAYGIGSQETPRFRALDAFGSIPLNGQLMVFDAASQSVVEIPFPDSDIPSEIINPALFVSPDGRHIVLSVRWTDAGGDHARSWITTTDGRSGWTPVEGGLVIGWAGE